MSLSRLRFPADSGGSRKQRRGVLHQFIHQLDKANLSHDGLNVFFCQAL